MKKPSIQQSILAVLGTRPVSFNPVLSRIAGSINAGLLLSQLLYWQGIKGEGEWFYKTQAEVEAETCLTRREFDTARKALRDLEITEEQRRGSGALVHYRVNSERLISLLGMATDASPNGVHSHSERRSEDIPSNYAESTREDTESTHRGSLAQSPPSGSSPYPEPDRGRVIGTLPLVGQQGDFPLYEDDLARWSAAFPGIDVKAELKRAKAWLVDNPKLRKTKTGVRRFVNAWLSRAQDRTGATHGPIPFLHRTKERSSSSSPPRNRRAPRRCRRSAIC